MLFPQEKTGATLPDGPLKLTIKEPRQGVFTAHYKGKRVGAVSTWNDLQHKKFSVFKSETHPDYRQRGVMTALYQHIETTTGKQLHPSSSLSDDGHAFWSKYRPEAVENDLRKHRGKLMDKEIDHPIHGKGRITSVGSGMATATRDDGKTFPVNRDRALRDEKL